VFSRVRIYVVVFALVTCSASAGPAGEAVPPGGNERGLVVVIGCDPAGPGAGLKKGRLTEYLDTDRAKVDRMRRRIQQEGLSGRVSARAFDGKNLPYVDNLVNHVAVRGAEFKVAQEEIRRVLAPGGAAVILKGPSGAASERFSKPRPQTIDTWTHFFHDADNNAVARDSVVAPPGHVQWLGGPTWTRHHDVDKGGNPAIRPVLTSGRRLHYMVDETRSSDMSRPGRWFLHARDAFNGILLWKKAVKVQRETLDSVWRTMVVDEKNVYAPLGPGQPPSVIDGATGRTLRTCAGPAGYTEVVKHGPALFLTAGGAVVSVSTETGKPRWTWRTGPKESIVRFTLAASDGRVFVRTTTRVCCLSAENGTLKWQWAAASHKVPMKRPRVATHERLLVAGGVVLVSHGGKDPNVLSRDAHIYKGSHARVHDYGGRLSALSADDGRVLWTTDYLPSLDDRKPGEIYVVGDTVWLGPDFSRPRELRTGKVRQTRNVLERLWTDGHHYRCYPGKATIRYIMTPKRGTEMFDLAGDNHSRNNWLRSTCTIGVTPANGLIYNPPHSCGCYVEAQLYGFWALAGKGARKAVPAVPDAQRLEKGPAYGKLAGRSAGADRRPEWPTHRGNNERAASSPHTLPDRLTAAWTATVGPRPGAVTAGGGKVFAVSVDGNTLHALSAKTGAPAWRFAAGGRIDSPPTFVSDTGSVLLGARDGYVYCLRASDGAVAWRFLAARGRMSTVAFGQVESVWPVHGAVLVRDGAAYVCAGRSSYLDGGIDLYALDVATGKVLHRRTVASTPVGAMDPPADAKKYARKIGQNWLDYKTFLAADKSDSFSMSGLRTDVMSARGGDVFLRHMAFDSGLKPRHAVAPHLMSTSSILDDTQHNRAYWILGTGNFARIPVACPWILQKKIAVPYGVMISFDEKTVWCVRQQGRKRGRVQYELVAVPRPDPAEAKNRQPDFKKRAAAVKPLWHVTLPLRPHAMLRAGDAVYVAGLADAPVLLKVARDGITQRYPLPGPPSWDGLAAAYNKLYISLQTGKIICLSGN